MIEDNSGINLFYFISKLTIISINPCVSGLCYVILIQITNTSLDRIYLFTKARQGKARHYSRNFSQRRFNSPIQSNPEATLIGDTCHVRGDMAFEKVEQERAYLG